MESMESSPPRTSAQPHALAGSKRAASLLPPFEPLSSSPPLPRPTKRLARESHEGEAPPTYPTPVPTSSTAILTSSPSRPQHPNQPPSKPHAAAAPASSTQSTFSERAPLSAVPCVMLHESGETVSMGRSSASCNYQLSSSRLISRVHVKASFKPAAHPFDRDRVEVLCTGWNGIKLHCQGKTYELTKGKTFTSDIKDADVMIDVQDARVLVQWPRPRSDDRKDSGSAAESNSDNNTWEEGSPAAAAARNLHRPRARGHTTSPRNRPRLVSPVSPSPAVQSLSLPAPAPAPAPAPDTAAAAPPAPTPAPSTPTRAAAASSGGGAVVVYEDEPSPTSHAKPQPDPISVSQVTEIATSSTQENKLPSSQSSSFDSKSEELSEHDEENDPIIYSFGPYGENILPRMASFKADDTPARSPQKPAAATSSATTTTGAVPSKRPLDDPKRDTVRNHIINQLAFSRLASTPMSTIVSHLPNELVKRDTVPDGLSLSEIKDIVNETKSIGEVTREGKDAAGKPLESEYYYVPDFDNDESRKEAVVNGLQKPGLRNCRKQHKQYFWRRPKTP